MTIIVDASFNKLHIVIIVKETHDCYLMLSFNPSCAVERAQFGEGSIQRKNKRPAVVLGG